MASPSSAGTPTVAPTEMTASSKVPTLAGADGMPVTVAGGC